MEKFSSWTKENITDIIFNFNKKNAELLRNFISWYNFGDNFIYILSNREFYSTECLILLQSTINSFVQAKNDNLEKKVVAETVVAETVDENDSDEYVINDEYYSNNKDEDTKDLDKEIAEDLDEVIKELDNVTKDLNESTEILNENDDDINDDDTNDNKDNLIITKFSNNEIMLLLNILEDDKKRYKKHNYIISVYKQELLLSRNINNNICMGITTGLLFYFLFRLL